MRARRDPILAAQHSIGRALNGAPADERTDRDAWHTPACERIAKLADGEDRADGNVGVARSEQDHVRIGERFEHAWRRPRVFLPLEPDGVDLVAMAASDEPLLKRKRAGRGLKPRPQPVVCGRKQPRLDTERNREPSGHGR